MDIKIIYGSETGNAESLAEIAGQRLSASGMTAEVINMGDIKAEKLQEFSHLLVITSTWGDGEPPSNAWDLWGQLSTKPGLDLSGLHFAVLGLGDTSYPQFCQCAKDFDTWLSELGGKRICERVDCDLDFEAPFETWIQGVTSALSASTVS